MPPWNQMTPQQQQMFMRLMMNRGTAGMQPGMQGGMPGMQQPMMGQPQQMQPPYNALLNSPQMQNMQNMQNPQQMQGLLPYLMGQGGGMGQQLTLGQLLALQQQGAGGLFPQ